MPETIKGGQPTSTAVANKLMMLWFGMPGSGKTSAMLTYPPPLHYVNLDRDPSELFKQLPPNHEITYEGIPYDVDTNPASATQILAKVDSMARKAAVGKKGSFLLDGLDLLWEYVKVAKLPKTSGKDTNLAREYADANSWMHGFLGRLHAAHIHVGFTSVAREIWRAQSQGTGTYEPQGFAKRDRWMTHEVYLFSPEDTAPQEKPRDATQTGQSHRGYIKVSKYNEAEMVRRVVPNITFKILYKLSFGSLPKKHEDLWTPTASSLPTTDSPPKSTEG